MPLLTRHWALFEAITMQYEGHVNIKHVFKILHKKTNFLAKKRRYIMHQIIIFFSQLLEV